MSLSARPALAAALLLLGLLTTPALALVSSRQRHERLARREPAVAVAALLPWPDLVIASGARHLRFLSLEEPGAAFADAPASLDTEPADGCVAPPREAWTP